MLNIYKTENGTELMIALEGRLDTVTSPTLEGELKNALDGVESLIFDMEKLQYISSAGLRVLLSAQKVMNRQGSMVVRNASDDVKEIFDVTGFSDILTIE
ncbi:MAG: STAS domain-containing protein [Blautia sp.]|nr:STAS domain-containing protein [Blautia sp.]